VIFLFVNRQSGNTVMGQDMFNTANVIIFEDAFVVVYYAGPLFIECYLPYYVESLIFIRLLLPGFGVSSFISILVFNYYKVIKKSNVYLVQGIVTLIGSLVLNLIGYYLTKSAIVIAVISLIVLFCWYIFTNTYFIQKYKIDWRKNTFYL